jgi:uncharacterized membrane protein
VLELKVPELGDVSFTGVMSSLAVMLPKFLIFFFSFFTVAIFWVNHHHFFHQIKEADWKLLWLNNLLLFWLTVLPFTTAFLGDYPYVGTVVMIYTLAVGLAAGSFWLMVGHAFLKANLLEKEYSLVSRKKEVQRAASAMGLYFLTALISMIYLPLALVMIVIIPVLYFLPTLIAEG